MRLGMMILVTVMVMGALAVYEVKYEVRDIKQDVRELENNIAREKESIHVLEAEWAYLTRPERLSRLSEKYLELGPVQAIQIRDEASLNLPEKQPEDNHLASAGEGIR